jgi:putative hydrolase of the HAD superfamily
MTRVFDAVLLDAGGVLLYPDPEVLVPVFAYYGASSDPAHYFRAHYAAMAAKSREDAPEWEWSHFDAAFVEAIGVPSPNRSEAAVVLSRTRHAHIWRAPVAGSRDALTALNRAAVPVGVVSNASGQIEDILRRSGLCQVGEGDHPRVLCVVDSHHVGVAKPDPAIFEHALVHLDGIERSRIAYVGDSVTMDVGGATAAGLVPVLFDPFDDSADLFSGRRIRSLADVVAMATDG